MIVSSLWLSLQATSIQVNKVLYYYYYYTIKLNLRHFLRFVVSFENCVYLVGGLRRWYNPPWYSELVPSTLPSTPYDPLVLRNAFEQVFILKMFSPIAVKGF